MTIRVALRRFLWACCAVAAVGAAPTAASAQLRAGDVFRDCAACPQMVVIPAGRFTMGSPAYEDERYPFEGPTRELNVPSFAMGRYEVSREQFQTYVSSTRAVMAPCPSGTWQAPGFDQTASDPVVCVSWDDASAFVAWLAQRLGQPYRLPSEAEWEYATRAGTTARRPWGDSPSEACVYENVGDAALQKSFSVSQSPVHACADGFTNTAPSGRFKPNAFGLYDTLGNVSEWTQDCWNATFTGAPGNARPWLTEGCEGRVVRGGSWSFGPRGVRSAYRGWEPVDSRNGLIGFRVAKSLP